jgi:hypothetical protein
MTFLSRACAPSILALACAALSTPSHAAGDGSTAFDPVVAGPAHVEQGQWRSKIQQVFDARTRTLTRRLYMVWDPDPSRELDFVWTPDNPAQDKEGRINGAGTLTWRDRSKASYESDGVFSEYRGSIRHGRIDGLGVYLDRTGLMYEGGWKAGMMYGKGTLKLPSGDEYTGEFRAGRANGIGRYIDITGEVYEGPFVDGYRHGKGTTTLPQGYRYVSQWTNGAEAPNSRLVRIAQVGKAVDGGADDVRIGITIDKRLPPPPRDNPRPQNGDLWYAVTNGPDGLLIRPDDARLMQTWKGGGEIQLSAAEELGDGDGYGIFSKSKGQLVPLKLNLEVQNRSSATLNVTGAYLDVQNSTTDSQPALQMSVRMHSCFEPFYRPQFKLENFGWAPAEQSTFLFDFASPSTRGRPTTFDKTKSLGSISKTAEIDLEANLKSAGVKTSFLARNKGKLDCAKPKTPQSCLQGLKASGTFGSLADRVALVDDFVVTHAVGQIQYTWRDARGTVRQGVAPFNAALPLGEILQDVECGEGGSRQVITAVSQQLQLDAGSYRVPVAFKSTISAGNTNRLTLPLTANKSSEHKFTVVLQLSDGREIRSRHINLLYYRPSWPGRVGY